MSDSSGIPSSLTYSADQLHAYYDRIGLPQKWRIEPGSRSESVTRDPEQGLAFLSALQLYHVTSVPFENLDLHYNRHHAIYIDPPHLFRKIVESKRGRGGYCMESNGLFGAVLRSLGFDVYPAGARVYLGGFTGWSHMVHIVTLGSKRYQVDVAFGSAGPTSPLLLDEASLTPTENVPPQKRRLRRSVISDSIRSTVSKQLLWIYEVQNEPDNGPWLPMYCFCEHEFLPADFEVMNFFTSQSPQIWFRHSVVCEKHILKDGKVIGNVSIFKQTLSRREHGQKVLDVALETELERIQALHEHLNVSLTLDEQEHIRGLPSAIA